MERTLITEPAETLLLRYGEDILSSPSFLKLKDYRHHENSNTYDHCVAVTLEAINFARKMHIKVIPSVLVRGCLLHDYYLYDHHGETRPRWHWTRHGVIAANNAIRDFHISAQEADMIANHMWPLHPLRFPFCVEGWILVLADKKVAIRDRVHAPVKTEQ